MKVYTWYGGFWERLIGLTKMTHKKELGKMFISLTGLQTVITEIEAVLNDQSIDLCLHRLLLLENEVKITHRHSCYSA